MDTRYYDLYAAWMEGFLSEYDLLVAGGVVFFLASLGISFLLLIYHDWLFNVIGDNVFFENSGERQKTKGPCEQKPGLHYNKPMRTGTVLLVLKGGR